MWHLMPQAPPAAVSISCLSSNSFPFPSNETHKSGGGGKGRKPGTQNSPFKRSNGEHCLQDFSRGKTAQACSLPPSKLCIFHPSVHTNYNSGNCCLLKIYNISEFSVLNICVAAELGSLKALKYTRTDTF